MSRHTRFLQILNRHRILAPVAVPQPPFLASVEMLEQRTMLSATPVLRLCSDFGQQFAPSSLLAASAAAPASQPTVQPAAATLADVAALAPAGATSSNYKPVTVDPSDGLRLTTARIYGEWATAGNTDGWTIANAANSSVAGGVLTATSQNGTAYPLQISLTGIAGGPNLDWGYFDYLQIRMQLPANYNKDITFFYTTTVNTTFSSSRTFTIPAAQVAKDGAFHTYRLDLGLVVDWRDTLTGLRIQPLGTTGANETVALDYVEVGDLPGDTLTPYTADLNMAPGVTTTSRQSFESKHFVFWWDPAVNPGNQTNWTTMQRNALRMMEESYQVYYKVLGFKEPFNYVADGLRHKSNITTWYGGYWMGGPYCNVDTSGLQDEGWGNPVPHEFGHVVDGQQPGFLAGGHWESHANVLREAWVNWFAPHFSSDWQSTMDLGPLAWSNYHQDMKRLIYADYRIHLALQNYAPDPSIAAKLWASGTTQNLTVYDKLATLLPAGVTVQDVVGDTMKYWPLLDLETRALLRAHLWSTADAKAEYDYRTGSYLIPSPDQPGWYRVPFERSPEKFAYMFHDLVPSSTSVTVTLHGLDLFTTDEGWRWCLAEVDPSNNVRYSPVIGAGTQTFTLNSASNKLVLIVVATPGSTSLDLESFFNTKPFDKNADRMRYPYEVQITGAAPAVASEQVSVAIPAPSGYHYHTNGGGLVANTATVASTAYVGPNARVLESAQVTGYARIEDYAVVCDSATVRDYARVSGFAWIRDNGAVSGYARIRDHATIANGCRVQGNAIVEEFAYCYDNLITDSAIVRGNALPFGNYTVGGTAILDYDYSSGWNMTDGVHYGHYPWGADNFENYYDVTLRKPRGLMASYRVEDPSGEVLWDEFGSQNAWLRGSPTRVEDAAMNSKVLALNGTSQYALLDRSVADFTDGSYAMWIKPTTTAAGQTLLYFGNPANSGSYLKLVANDSAGYAHLYLSVNGTLKELASTVAIPANAWTHLALTFGGGTATFYVNGQAAGSVATTFRPTDILGPNTYAAAEPFYLGRDTTGNYFAGNLEDIRFYNVTLTPAEVLNEQQRKGAKLGLFYATTPQTFDGATTMVESGVRNGLVRSLYAWIKPHTSDDAGSYYEPILDSTFENDAGIYGTGVGLDAGKFVVRLDGYGMWNTNISVTLNKWQHVGLTFDGTAARFYVNGTLRASLTYSANANNLAGKNYRIGWGQSGRDTSSRTFFDGEIYDVEILDRVAVPVPNYGTPVAVNDSSTLLANTGATVLNVLSNDYDTQPVGMLTVSAVTQPAHGTVTRASDGSTVTYTPAAGYAGADSFTYTISDGFSGTSTATVSINLTQSSGLPTGWTNADVGSPTLVGSVSQASGKWTIYGGGAGTGATSDQLHFAWRSFAGDVILSGRVLSQTNTNASAKAGLMIRDSSAADAPFALVALTPSNGIAFQWRSDAGGATSTASVSGITAPVQLKLVRQGSTVSAYYSTDGVNWIQVGAAQTVNLSAAAQVGLAVTSQAAGSVSQAVFNNVAVTSATGPTIATQPYATPATVTAKTTLLRVLGADDGGEAALIYTWQALDSNPAAVTFSANGTNAAKSSTVTFTAAGTYQFQVLITDAQDQTVISQPITVIVNQTPTKLTMGTAPSHLLVGAKYGFIATAYDQFNNPMAGSYALTWTLGTGPGGTILNNGLYTAPATGTGTQRINVTGSGLSAYVDVPIINPTVAWWKLDGNGTDSSGNNNTLTLVNSPAFTTTQVGTGFSLTGSAYGQTATSILPTNVAFSVSAWVNWNGDGGFNSMLSEDGATNSTFYFQKRSGGSFALVGDDGGGGQAYAMWPQTPTANTWYHLVGVYTGSALQLYVNGSLVATTAWTTVGAPTGGVIVGAAKYGGGRVDQFHGMLDEVRLFNTALNANDVEQLYNSSLNIPTGWTDSDVGDPLPSGNANSTNGTVWTVRGGGLGIGGTADQGNFAWKTVTGSATIVAQVTSMTNTDAGAKAGIMVRTSLRPDSISVGLFVTPSGQTQLVTRSALGATSVVASVAGDPRWLKLVRTGSTVTGYYSSNGTTWTQIGSPVSIGTSAVHIGLAVTSNNTSSLCQAAFSNVLVMENNLPPTVATPAAASPAVVTTANTALSVLGADDFGEENLLYTWSWTGPTGVTFSDNITNTAKNVTATFTQPGSYHFTATITDAAGAFVTSSVDVTVVATLAGIAVTPSSLTMPGETRQTFTASAVDQFGNALPSTISWSTSAGSITSGGVFTAPMSGTVTITASGSGTTGTATVTVTGPSTNWKFDENTGTTANDSSGNSHTGTIASGTAWTGGISGSALSFNGSSMRVTSTTASLSGTGNFTVGAWVRTTATSAGVIVQQRGANSGHYQLSMAAAGTVAFWCRSTTTGYQFNLATTQIINDGQWHYVTGVRQGATGYIYIDGVQRATGSSGSTLRSLSSSNGVGVGADTYSNNTYFNGTIDDVRIFTTAWSATDVLRLYNIANPAPTVVTPAAASPNPVTGATTNLSVLGADNGGEASLIYTWSVTSKPEGAADPTFSVNGTNAAKNAIATFTSRGTYLLTVTIADAAGASTTSAVSVTLPFVAGRYIFYNSSYYDGNNAAATAADDSAIDTSKSALLPGQTATFANYTASSKGINGIMVDIAGLPNAAGLTAADFDFKVGNTATPSSWADAPAPLGVSVRAGAGTNGADRVTLVWADGAIQKQWLQVTVKATANTGLAAPDVFYFGNAVGETGNSATNAYVDAADYVGVRDHPRNFANRAPVDYPYDLNKDSFVDGADLVIARDNNTNFITVLKLITAPAAPAGAPAPSAPSSSDSAVTTPVVPILTVVPPTATQTPPFSSTPIEDTDDLLERDHAPVYGHPVRHRPVRHSSAEKRM